MQGVTTSSTANLISTLSLKGKKWVLNQPSEVSVLNLIQKYNFPEVVAHLIAQRCPEHLDVHKFLSTKIKDYFQDPFSLKDMPQAIDRICRAIDKGEKIGILGDYDVDGATSTSLFLKYFEALGIDVIYHIPDRITEGYGPSRQGIDFFASKDVSLIITVDCGTAAHEVLSYAQKKGIDVVVVDHHIPEEELPQAVAIVNPNREDDKSGLGHLCAAGVSFFVLAALQKKQDPLSKRINLLSLLDLVALGTVCDVVPLKGINKAFVSQGLRIMEKGLNPGIQTLFDSLSVTPPLSEYHLGYVVGPHINAGGRIGLASLGTELLTAKTPQKALSIVQELVRLNTERKALEGQMIEESIQMAEVYKNDRVICLGLDGWHPGVIGIVASRIKEKFGKPSFIIGFDAEGLGKGSGRSVKGVNLGDLVQKAKDQGLLVNGGGHEMAAGLTLQQEKLDSLRQFFNQNTQKPPPAESLIDVTVSISGIHLDLIDWVEKVGPFGAGNPQPVFMIPNCMFQDFQIRKEKHISFRLRGEEGKTLEGMAFNVVGTALESAFKKDSAAHVIGRLQADTWQGKKRIKFYLEDVIIPTQ